MCSGGESGEEILQRLVEGIPERLEADGTAQIITATTLERVGSRSSRPTAMASSSWVNTTPNTDTIE